MTIFFVALMGGICVAAMFLAAATMFRSPADTAMHDRLDVLAGKKAAILEQQSVLAHPLDDMPNAIEEYISNFFNLRRLLDQADIDMSVSKFAGVSLGLAGVGLGIAAATRFHPSLYVALPLLLLPLPMMWAFWKRKKRLKLFTKQLPEAMDMIGRALRAGHSLSAGFQMAAAEIPDPLGTEFGRVYEEQNLGIPMEDSLGNMCDRMPSLDLRFFSTAVILQRTTGGDLAEILEKISHVIRERFKIFGQIQALTGEGRLSGTVLLAMPPVLMATMMVLNYEYVMLLFNTKIGNQMLGFASVMQVVGALVIKKIINIKV